MALFNVRLQIETKYMLGLNVEHLWILNSNGNTFRALWAWWQTKQRTQQVDKRGKGQLNPGTNFCLCFHSLSPLSSFGVGLYVIIPIFNYLALPSYLLLQ